VKKSDLFSTIFWLALCIYALFVGVILAAGWAKDGNAVVISLMNVCGAVLAHLGSLAAFSKYLEWYKERNEKRLYRIVSSEVGRPVTDLVADQDTQQVLKVLVARYSNDRFCNRVSDGVGTLNRILDSLGMLGCIGLVLASIYLGFEEGFTSDYVYGTIWGSVFVVLLSNLIQIVNEFLSELLFGRWPSEARLANRNIIPELIAINAKIANG